MNWKWVQSIWSEPDGSGSASRILMTVIIAYILGLTTPLAIQATKGKLTLNEFDNYLESAGTFIATTCGPLYLANKATDWLKNKDNKDGDK